ncbi:MAG: Maf family protein, partial [Eubacteriaceae bacterium]
MTPIYLASASPRRKELLEQIGLDFSVIIRNVDENIEQSVLPSRLVE